MKSGSGLTRGRWAFVLAGAVTLVAAVHGCNAGGPDATSGAAVSQIRSALSTAGDPVPCAAWGYAIGTNGGNVVMLNSQTVVDSYSSSAGAYGGANVGSNAVVQAAGSIINNGAVVRGAQRPNAPVGLPVVPVPSGAIKLPLGSSSPGSLNINTASQSITLAPGNYVAANITVGSPGRISISPAGQVRIWVTGSLNLGGSENANGIPKNLAFLVTSAGFVNVNSGGSLFGMIYAPTSTVNVSSPIFGTVIGSAVTLNSGSAVHFDQSSVCSQTGTAFNPGGDSPLPAPPTTAGCYIFTLNGWVQVQCQDPTVGIPGFTHLDVARNGVSAVTGGSAVPFVYGQLETTVVSVDSLAGFNAKDWSVQNNTNSFNCTDTTLGVCLIQFAVIQEGNGGSGAVCITNAHNLNTNPDYANNCVGLFGTNVTSTGGIQTNLDTRQGGLQTGDYANLAGYTFTSNGQPMLGLVAQFSWVTSTDSIPVAQSNVPNLVPGLYAVVTPDTGLAGHWTSVRGSLVGEGGSAAASFVNGELLTRIAASSCPGDVSASGPTCSGQPALTPSNVQFVTNGTDFDTGESNNLTLFSATPALTFPNADLVVTDILASTNVPSGSSTATCLSSVPNHLFLRDNEGDNGGVPSNIGNVPFWESPDIFIVPQGGPTPGANDTPADVEVTAGQPYNVYLRVHNDYGCTAISGPVSVFIDAADPNMGYQNWSPVTTGASSGQYTTVSTPVPAFGTAILGPFAWTPPGSGHKCLIAAVSANSETAPTVTISPGQPVLPAAYSSNQIAQRNLQISDSCSYSITNTLSTNANLLLGISVSPATPAPGTGGGAGIVLTFADPNQTFFNAWTGQSGIVVGRSGSNTTVTLNTSYIGLPTVPLGPGQSPSVSMTIQPGSQAAPTVNVSAILTDPLTGNILEVNGGSCQGNGNVIIPPG
jgi:hypothetical protein